MVEVKGKANCSLVRGLRTSKGHPAHCSMSLLADPVQNPVTMSLRFCIDNVFDNGAKPRLHAKQSAGKGSLELEVETFMVPLM